MKRSSILFPLILFPLITIHALFGNDTEYDAWWNECVGSNLPYAEFASWLQPPHPTIQAAVRRQIREKKYASVLNIPCGLCYDYFGIKNDGVDVQYVGCDVACNLVNLALERGIPVKRGSIEEIPFCDSEFDLVYSRGILEHLPYYESAVIEMVRVAKKEVLVVFSIAPGQEDVTFKEIIKGHPVYHNSYDRRKFENFVLFLPKVQNVEWEDEVIAHIYLKMPR